VCQNWCQLGDCRRARRIARVDHPADDSRHDLGSSDAAGSGPCAVEPTVVHRLKEGTMKGHWLLAAFFGWIHQIACPSENVLYVGELLNWRVQKLILHP
jgi:hypothetical protein